MRERKLNIITPNDACCNDLLQGESPPILIKIGADEAKLVHHAIMLKLTAMFVDHEVVTHGLDEALLSVGVLEPGSTVHDCLRCAVEISELFTDFDIPEVQITQVDAEELYALLSTVFRNSVEEDRVAVDLRTDVITTV